MLATFPWIPCTAYSLNLSGKVESRVEKETMFFSTGSEHRTESIVEFNVDGQVLRRVEKVTDVERNGETRCHSNHFQYSYAGGKLVRLVCDYGWSKSIYDFNYEDGRLMKVVGKDNDVLTNVVEYEYEGDDIIVRSRQVVDGVVGELCDENPIVLDSGYKISYKNKWARYDESGRIIFDGSCRYYYDNRGFLNRIVGSDVTVEVRCDEHGNRIYWQQSMKNCRGEYRRDIKYR